VLGGLNDRVWSDGVADIARAMAAERDAHLTPPGVDDITVGFWKIGCRRTDFSDDLV